MHMKKNLKNLATGNRQRLSAPPEDHGHTTEAVVRSRDKGF